LIAPTAVSGAFNQLQFLDEVGRMAALETDGEAEEAVMAVFAALQDAFGSPDGTTGMAGHVMSQLPTDLKRLWLAADGRLWLAANRQE
jgi:uncharacterized protein (DUF2267 family)